MLVRLFVEDDARQSELARAVVRERFTVSASVLVETEWVLRAVYRWPRPAIAGVLAELCDFITLADAPPGTLWAIERFAKGADFADMIHLASAGSVDRFATFDSRLSEDAGPDAPVAIETLG